MDKLPLEDSEESDVAKDLSDMVDEWIAAVVEESQAIMGVRVGDVIDVPEEGECVDFPFCANVLMTADAVGSHGVRRRARITRVYLLVDFEGRHSVNWVGRLMSPRGGWLDLDVLVARIEQPAEAPLRLVG